jgi:acyl carrier protein
VTAGSDWSTTGTGSDRASSVEERVKGVLRDVFGASVDPVGHNTSKDSVEGWDSLQHLTLVLSLEEEFDIHFDDEESMALVSYPLIVAIVSDRVTGASP